MQIFPLQTRTKRLPYHHHFYLPFYLYEKFSSSAENQPSSVDRRNVTYCTNGLSTQELSTLFSSRLDCATSTRDALRISCRDFAYDVCYQETKKADCYALSFRIAANDTDIFLYELDASHDLIRDLKYSSYLSCCSCAHSATHRSRNKRKSSSCSHRAH